MRTQHFTKRDQGLTWIEVLIVVAVLAILTSIWLPRLARSKFRSSRSNCTSNVKQIGIAFRLYANDNDVEYPQSLTNLTQAWQYFQQLGNELSSPKVLICPSDGSRPANGHYSAADFTSMSNGEPATNNFSHPIHRDGSLSYFVGLDAKETRPQMILTGDRNLTMKPLPSGNIWTLGINSTVGWTEKMHDKGGNVGLADGSAEQITNRKLIEKLRNTGDTTNRIVMPQ